jgi:hypothetical protein
MPKFIKLYEVIGIPSGEVKTLNEIQFFELYDIEMIHYNHIHRYWYFMEDKIDDTYFEEL